MKNKSLKLLTLLGVITFVSSSHAVMLIHGVGVNNNGSGLASSYTSWEATGVNGTATSHTTTIVGVDIGGEIFNYDITVASVTPEILTFANPNDLLGSGTGSFDANGDGFTVTIDNITNVNVLFDGFTRFAVGNGGDEHTINGSTIVGGTTGTDLTVAPFNTPNTFTYNLIVPAGANGQTGRYLDFQFSTVPEPSSYALLAGLLGFGYVMARRRRS